MANGTLQNIAGALSGFSAGVAGTLPAFLAQREEQRQTLNTERRNALLSDNRSSIQFLQNGDTEGALSLLRNRAANIETLGGDPQDTLGQIRRIESGDVQGALESALILDNRAVDEGVLRALPTKAIDKIIKIENGVAFIQAPDGTLRTEAFKGAAIEDDGVTVRSSEILADGTTIQSTDDGVRVFAADGTQLEGINVAKAIRAANEEGIRITGAKAAIKKEADKVSQSISKAGEAFDKIGPVRQTIRSIDQAITAIDDGASTGVVEKFLPSVKAASIRLDTIMNQLGLDVVSSTTFGALSAGELALALDTALPTGLEPPELRVWLTDKKSAQQKLIRGLEDSAIFLMEGNTISDLVKLRRGQQDGQPTTSEATPTPSVTPVTTPAPIQTQAQPTLAPVTPTLGATDAQGFTIGGGGNQQTIGEVSKMSDEELRRLAGL